jgi:hypothetical protein
VSFARYVALVLGVACASLLGLWRALQPEWRLPAAAGAALAVLNTVAAYGLVVWASGRSTNVFLGAVLGGMVGRMGVMLVAVVAAVLLLGLPKVPLALSLLSYFVVFLVFELAVLQRRTTHTEATRS